MKIEVRSDGAHISGYVNATEKKSKPVITPKGKVVEVIERRAFEKAIENRGTVNVTVDHDSTCIYASTEDGTLELYEDAIGLHADVLITDPDLIDLAQKGKIKGWSFGMHNVIDEMEERAEDYPIRHVKSFDLDHVTLVVKSSPVYAATSVEVRAGEDVDIETRSFEDDVKLKVETPVEETKEVNNSKFTNRLMEIEAGL